MTYYNDYPNVFIHGLYGWGEGDKLDSSAILPYWGRGDKNLMTHLQRLGYEVYYPSLGPFNSAWDRACILWAYLFGGTVDYGKVHSEKFHHARYGATFEHGVLEDLGKTEKHKKMNLFGHSFGGATVKEVVNLFTQGSEEERQGTPADELSPLFLGGHDHLLHCVTTLSGVNNGTTAGTLTAKSGITIAAVFGIMFMNSVEQKTLLKKYYDFDLKQWGDSPLGSALKYAMNTGEDNIGGELRVEVVQEKINPRQVISPHAYYFAQRAYKTHGDLLGKQIPSLMSPMCFYPAMLLGQYRPHSLKKYGVRDDKNWLRNDGYVNLVGCSAPLNQPHQEADWHTDFKPGMWYNMPPVFEDHLFWNGMSGSRKDFIWIYEQMLETYRTLPDG